MGRSITDRDWPRIRYAYEHTDKLRGEICAEHRISTTTLNSRARQWGWTRRRQPVPADGPALPQVEAPPLAAAQAGTTPLAEPSAHLPPPPAAPVATWQIAQALQNAIARVLTAIDLALAGLSAASSPREIERAGRAVAGLTRTLQELNALKAQSPAFEYKERGPDDNDEFARVLLRRLAQFKAERGIP